MRKKTDPGPEEAGHGEDITDEVIPAEETDPESLETDSPGTPPADPAAEARAGAKSSGSGKVNKGVVVALVVSLVATVLLGLWGAGLFEGDGSSAESDQPAPAAEATPTPAASRDSSIVAPGTIAGPREPALGEETDGSLVPTDTTQPPIPLQIAPGIEEVLEEAEMFFEWGEVEDPSGVTYTLEIETYSLDAKAYVPFRTFTNIRDTRWRHEMPTYLERWRIWAVDGAGNASEATEWRVFSRKLLTAPITPSERTDEEPADD